MSLFLHSFLVLLSFYLLAKVCDDYFVGSLDKIAKKLKMSSDVAGATLMAVGSSAPELFVSIIALLKPGNHEAVGMGTIVGSALFNILVIIGASAVIRKAVLVWQPIVRDTVFYSISIIALIIAFWDGKIVFYEAMMFVVLYLLYIFVVIKWRKIFPYKDEEKEEPENDVSPGKKGFWQKITKPIDFFLNIFFPNPKHFYFIFLISIILIAGLSWVLVDSAVIVAHILNIPEVIIALTVLAIGTSVPDMMSSLVVAKQGRGGMAISNAIGSNIFDILFGLGVPWFLVLLFQEKTIPVSTENLLSSIILLFATVLVIFFLLFLRKWKIGAKAGYFLIALYIIYLLWSIGVSYNLI